MPATPRTSTTGQPYARTLSAPATPRTITPQPQVAKGTDPSVVNAYDATEPLISARAATVPVSGPRPPTPSSPPPGSGPAGLGPAGSVQGPGQTPASGVRVTTPPSGVRSSTTATPPVGVRAITPSGGLPRTLTPSGGYGGNTNDHSSTRPAAESGPLPAVMDSGEFEQRASSADSAAAEDAFERGSSALRREDLAEAIEHLSRATTLNPQSIDYLAVLAWARFIATSDKASVADETRKTLLRAVAKSKSPEVAYFYLGRVERMLGNDRHALRYFREVVEIKPRHADAKAEIRILEQKVQAAAAREKSGLFGIKKR